MQIIWSSHQTDNHTSTSWLNFLQAGCCPWRPTNSVKALKARPQVLRKSFGSHLHLRPRAHDRSLPERLTHLTDCNFIIRMLLYQVYWLYLMPACFHCLSIAFWQLLNTRICYVMLPAVAARRWTLPARSLVVRVTSFISSANFRLCRSMLAVAWRCCRSSVSRRSSSLINSIRFRICALMYLQVLRNFTKLSPRENFNENFSYLIGVIVIAVKTLNITQILLKNNLYAYVLMSGSLV